MEVDLTGKWKYQEDYGFGETEGELFLEQEGDKLSGKVVFTDRPKEGDVYMMQEFVEGSVCGRKVRLQAVEVDVVYSNENIDYELDAWFGVLVEENLIVSVSRDRQGVDGISIFERI